MDKTNQPSCSDVITHVNNKRASPRTRQRWGESAQAFEQSSPALGMLLA